MLTNIFQVHGQCLIYSFILRYVEMIDARILPLHITPLSREQHGCIISKWVGPEWTWEFRARLTGQLCAPWLPLQPCSKVQSSCSAGLWGK